MLITNHVYDVVGSYIPTKEMAGGSGLKYSASTICFLGKKKEKDGTEVVGNIIKVKMAKSRFTKENKQVEVLLTYDIFKKVANRYELLDGSKVYGKVIQKDPQKYFTKDVMEKIEKAVEKEFLYGDYVRDTKVQVSEQAVTE